MTRRRKEAPDYLLPTGINAELLVPIRGGAECLNAQAVMSREVYDGLPPECRTEIEGRPFVLVPNASGTPELAPAEIVEPWPEEEAREFAATARGVLSDPYHASGHGGDNSRLSRENCAVCVLNVYEPRGGYEDDYSVKRDGPNYAGWPRIYVEARRAIPLNWRHVVERHIDPSYDNQAYAAALRRSIATFGIHFEKEERKRWGKTL